MSSSSSSSSSSDVVSIEAQDVIRLILQFLKENNLTESLGELQKESGITLNTVDDVDSFLSDVRYGRWDSVLAQVSNTRLPAATLISLYEQILLELLEAGEKDLAREILQTAEPLLLCKLDQPERYARLDTFCKRPFFNASDVYELGQSKDSRRQELVAALAQEVMAVDSSRLLTLLGDAMRYHFQRAPAVGKFDIFRGAKHAARREAEEKIVKRQCDLLQSTHSGQKLETFRFTPDGSSCVLGCVAGWLEVCDSDTYALRKDLDYQAQGPAIRQTATILCVSFSKDGDHFVAGSSDGLVNVYRVSSGATIRSFSAHSQGVASVCFSKDSSQVLTASYDSTARIHGLRSGKTLKEFRGHAAYVHCAAFTRDAAANVLTASADGTVKLWDARTTECRFTYKPGGPHLARDSAVLCVLPLPKAHDQYVVCGRSSHVHVISGTGQAVVSMASGKASGGDFVAATLSPNGRYLYCAGEDKKLYIFDMKAGQLEEVADLQAKEGALAAEVVQLEHHPHRSLLAVVLRDGTVKFLGP